MEALSQKKKIGIIAGAILLLTVVALVSTGRMSLTGLSSSAITSPTYVCSEQNQARNLAQYNQIPNNITNANNKISIISGEIKVLQDKINAHNTTIAQKQAQITTRPAEIARLNGLIVPLTTFINTKCSKPTGSMVRTCNDKKKEKLKYENEITKLNNLENDITKLQNEIGTPENSKSLKGKIQLKENQIGIWQGKIAGYELSKKQYERCALELKTKPTVFSGAMSGEIKLISGEIQPGTEKLVSGEVMFFTGTVIAPHISGEVTMSGEVGQSPILTVVANKMEFSVKPTPENNFNIKNWFLEFDQYARTACTSKQVSSNPVEIKVTCNLPAKNTPPIIISAGTVGNFKLIGKLGSITIPLAVETNFVSLQYNGSRTDIDNQTAPTKLRYEKPPVADAYFRYASWTCHNGEKINEGGTSSCKSQTLWKQYAETFCQNKCSPETGKCGVNSYSNSEQCISSVCGNGIKEGAEQCDDGNTTNGDGCSNTCISEANRYLTAANILASMGLIVDHSANPVNYRLNDTIIRQEATKLAAGVHGGILTNEIDYKCTGMFSDAPDGTWVCRVAELSKLGGILSGSSTLFRPTANLSKIEAIEFALRSTKLIPTGEHTNDEILKYAVDAHIIPSAAGVVINASLERGEYFYYLTQAIEAAKVPDICTIAPDLCPVPKCGNGTKEVTEQCDDGNTNNGDGCSQECTLEGAYPGYMMKTDRQEYGNGGTILLEISSMTSARGFVDLYIQPYTGYGSESGILIQKNIEINPKTTYKIAIPNYPNIFDETDNYLLVISAAGQVRKPQNVNSLHVKVSVPTSIICGNGIKEGAEQCDDGNTNNGDGCDSLCKSEVVNTCIDSDGGENIFKYGEAVIGEQKVQDQCNLKVFNGYNDQYNLVKSCTGSNCVVLEAICDKYSTNDGFAEYARSKIVSCPNGCNDGACKPADPVAEVCEDLAITPSAIQGGGTVNYTCQASNDILCVLDPQYCTPKTYSVVIKKPDGVVLQTYTTATGSITIPSSPNGTYTAECFVNGQTTTIDACKKPITNQAPVVACTGTLPTNASILVNVGNTSRAWTYDGSPTGPYQNCSFQCPAGTTYQNGLCTVPATSLNITYSGGTVAQNIAAKSTDTEGSKSNFQFVSTSGTSTITELKFTVIGNNTVANIKLGNTSAPVINGTALLTGLNITVPNNSTGIVLGAVLTYNDVGTFGTTSGTTSQLILSGVKFSNGSTTNTLSPNLSAPAMTLVGSKPTITVSQPNSILTVGSVEAIDVTITADVKGDIKINSLPIIISASNASFNTAANTLSVRDAGNTTISSQSTVFQPTTSGGSLSIVSFPNGYIIPAGTSQKFRIYAQVSSVMGIGTTGSSLSTSLYTNGFSWTDIAGGATLAQTSTNNIVGYPYLVYSVVKN